MTIRPQRSNPPEPRDETASPSDQRCDERLSYIGLLDRILSSRRYLLHLTLLLTVLATLITGVLWLLNAHVTIGPIQISPLPHTLLPL